MKEKVSDRIKGAVLGLAIGNSLGGTCLGMNRKEIMFAVGIRGVRDFTPGLKKSLLPTYEPGQLLADTLVTLEITRSLVRSGGRYNDADIKEHLTQLLQREQFLNSAAGAHCLLPLRRLADQSAASEDSSHNSAVRVAEPGDCGAVDANVAGAVRALGIGCLPDYEQVVKIAVEQAKLSELDTRVWAAAAVLASSVHALISGQLLGNEEEVRQFVRREFALAQSIDERFAEAWDDIAPDLDYLNPADDLPYSLINVDSHVNEAVPTAVGIFLIFRHDFEAAVSAAASCGGDTDTVAAIVGALSGAYHGAAAIPERWLKRISDRAELEQLSNELTGLWK